MEYRRLNKKAIGCMRMGNAVGFGVLILILAAARIILGLSGVSLPPWLDYTMLSLLLPIILYIIVAPLIRYRRYRYYVDEEQVVVEEGLWFISRDIAPIERIHQIAVRRGPIDRFFGLGKVICTTAGGTVTIRFLENKVAEDIAASLQRRIKGIVVAQRRQTDAGAADTESGEEVRRDG